LGKTPRPPPTVAHGVPCSARLTRSSLMAAPTRPCRCRRPDPITVLHDSPRSGDNLKHWAERTGAPRCLNSIPIGAAACPQAPPVEVFGATMPPSATGSLLSSLTALQRTRALSCSPVRISPSDRSIVGSPRRQSRCRTPCGVNDMERPYGRAPARRCFIAASSGATRRWSLP
jgi:hypothetical protein